MEGSYMCVLVLGLCCVASVVWGQGCVCKAGGYSSECILTCLCVNNTCHPKSGLCLDYEYGCATPTCSECVAGRWGSKCEHKCAPNCATGTCDKTAGKCFACLRGWSDMNCTSSCSSQNCLLNTCDQTTRRCLACNPGYDGDNCTDCAESYYNKGEGCLPCSSLCKDSQCDRVTGECSECVQGFSKHNTATCSPCSVSCSTGDCDKVSGNCIGECVAGRWGNKCEKKCAPNCATGTCNKTAGKCFACLPGWFGMKCNSSCSPQNCLLNTCDQTTGHCLACNTGYDGDNCTECVQGFSKHNTATCSPCSAFCSTGGCVKDSGNCNDGECVAGRWGNKCEHKCAPNCATGTCDKTAGTCFACLPGWFGMKCNSSCSSQNCLLNTCNQTTGHCLACNTGYDGDTCTGIDSSLKAEGSDQSHLAVVSGILGAGLMVTIAVLLFLCWRFRSHLMVQKPDTLTSVYADPVTAGSNAYTEPPSVALSPPDGACGNTQHEIRDPGNPYEQLRVYSNMMFDREAHSNPEPRGIDVTTPKSTSEYVNVTLEHIYANISSGPKTKKKPRKKKAK